MQEKLNHPLKIILYLCTEYTRSYRQTTQGDVSMWGLKGDRLGWLRLLQSSVKVTVKAVTTQNLNRPLFYGGSSDSEILQTRKFWILHVCYVKLENECTNTEF